MGKTEGTLCLISNGNIVCLDVLVKHSVHSVDIVPFVPVHVEAGFQAITLLLTAHRMRVFQNYAIPDLKYCSTGDSRARSICMEDVSSHAPERRVPSNHFQLQHSMLGRASEG